MIKYKKNTKKLIKIVNTINLIYTFAHNISKASIYIKKNVNKTIRFLFVSKPTNIE